MNKTKDITNRNSKGDYHGYQQWYHDGIMYRRGNSYHGFPIGYQEHRMHHFNNTLFIDKTSFYIK